MRPTQSTVRSMHAKSYPAGTTDGLAETAMERVKPFTSALAEAAKAALYSVRRVQKFGLSTAAQAASLERPPYFGLPSGSRPWPLSMAAVVPGYSQSRSMPWKPLSAASLIDESMKSWR